MSEPILCYVEGNWAYFTTQELSKQWGDDWDDAPYEHNAGTPYEYDGEEDAHPWEIVKVAWDGPFETPDYNHLNSPWSVEQINAGAVAWLVARYADPMVVIPAGVTLSEFTKRVLSAGGSVYAKEATQC